MTVFEQSEARGLGSILVHNTLLGPGCKRCWVKSGHCLCPTSQNEGLVIPVDPKEELMGQIDLENIIIPISTKFHIFRASISQDEFVKHSFWTVSVVPEAQRIPAELQQKWERFFFLSWVSLGLTFISRRPLSPILRLRKSCQPTWCSSPKSCRQPDATPAVAGNDRQGAVLLATFYSHLSRKGSQPWHSRKLTSEKVSLLRVP